MSQSGTWDTLQIARDARLCGHTLQYEALLAEAAPDFAYVRLSSRRAAPGFYFDEDEDESRSEQRADWAAWSRSEMRRDWTSWSNPLKLTDFDRITRGIYAAAGVSSVASTAHPTLSSLRRSTDHGFEMRIRSYATVAMPPWRGVFSVD